MARFPEPAQRSYGYSLIETTMSLGFAWESFALGERDVLLEPYPDFAKMIEALIR